MYPILTTIKGNPVYSYGFCAAVGFGLGIFFVSYWAAKFSLRWEYHFDYVLLGGFVFGLIGARLLAYISYGLIITNPLGIFNLSEGGFSFFGGIGAAIASYCFLLRWYNEPFWLSFDIHITGFCLSLAIGRFGCFLKGCCHGQPCPPPWGLNFVDFPGGPFFPIQLISSLGFLICFLIFSNRLKKKLVDRNNPPDGVIFAGVLIYIGCMRFILEYFRGDNDTFLGLSFYHLLAALFFFSGLIILKLRLKEAERSLASMDLKGA
ncbi:prolipoprotein diacylglyceryl transferase [Candidatus Riflebacteria bacterium]